MSVRKRIAETLAAASDPAPLVAETPVVPARELFRRFWPDVRPYRGWMLPSLLFVAAVPAIAVVEVWPSLLSHNLLGVDAACIVVLDRGRTVERGTHAGLLALDGVYARMRRVQLREGREREWIAA